MLKCPNCNKELSDDAKFCDDCGTKIVEKLFCPNCGTQMSPEDAFCQNCGASTKEKSENKSEDKPTADATIADKPVVEKKPSAVLGIIKNIPKKAIMFGGIGVAFVAVLIVAIMVLFGGKSENNYALYLKDSEIFFSDLENGNPSLQLTSRLFDTSFKPSNEQISNGSSNLGRLICMSEDGNYVFFPDKNGDSNEFNLYFRNVSDPKAEATKIDSGVRSYVVNSDATIVTYIKGTDGGLYQYRIDRDSKDKIASDVRRFDVSEDGRTIFYMNTERNIYLKESDTDKEKLASDVSELVYIDKNYETLYYIKESTLYKQTVGKDKIKIAEDVSKVSAVYDSGEIYYLTSNATETSLMDYVTDDLAEADAALAAPTQPTYPVAPSYPSWSDYISYTEYEAAVAQYQTSYEAYKKEYNRLNEEYQTAREEYNKKLNRDELRDRLNEEKLEEEKFSLCFFDGTDTTVITDACASKYSFIAAADAPVILYRAYNQTNVSKVKLSEIQNIYDVESMVETALSSSFDIYVAVKGSATLIELEKAASSIEINDSGTAIYYIDDISDTNKDLGELYRISINNGTVENPEVYDNDVYADIIYITEDDQVLYFKNYNDEKDSGDLYINREKVDYDVWFFNYVDGKVYYFTDWNDEKEYGILKVYQNGKATKIADDVYDFSVTSDERVLYLYDYSLTHYRGELYEWDDGDTRKIDDDVIGFIPVYTGKKGFLN